MTTQPRWRGVNHLALITPDMDATVRFYHGVLGMRLVTTLAVGRMRHYFFEIGDGSTLAFFEWKGYEQPTFEKPAGLPPDFPAQFDHVISAIPLGTETLWMDTTSEVAPFRLLSRVLRNKQALVIPDAGPAGHLAEPPVEGVAGVHAAVLVAEDEVVVLPGGARG